MSVSISATYQSGATLLYSLYRPSDQKRYDFTGLSFQASPSDGLAALPEGSGSSAGLYRATLATPAEVFTDGPYEVEVHDGSRSNLVIGVMAVVLKDGADVSLSPSTGGASLAADALDAIPVEGGVNAREALALILAAAAGTITGAGTGTLTVKAPGSGASRIVAHVDGAGNRTSTTLALPASPV